MGDAVAAAVVLVDLTACWRIMECVDDLIDRIECEDNIFTAQ